jgi:Tfp pilus assembly protein PilF
MMTIPLSRFLKIIPVGLCLMSAATLSHAQASPKLKAHMDACQQSLDQKDHVTAISECREALRIDPKIAEAYHNIGLAYILAGDFAFALKYFDEAIKLDPSQGDYYGNRAATATQLGMIGQALSDFDKAIELKPNHAQYFTDRGILNEQLDLVDLALPDYEKAIKLDPQSARAYKGLTKIYFDKANMEQVLSNSAAYLKFDPDDVETLIMRARMLKIKHDKFEPNNDQLLIDAVANCKHAAEKKPNHAPAHACLASVYLSKNEYGPSIASATKAIELGHTEGVYVSRAIAHFKVKDYFHANNDVEKAIDLGETIHPVFQADLIKETAAAAEAAASVVEDPVIAAAKEKIAAEAAAEEAAAAAKEAEEAAREAEKAEELAYRQAREDAAAAEAEARAAERDAAEQSAIAEREAREAQRAAEEAAEAE